MLSKWQYPNLWKKMIHSSYLCSCLHVECHTFFAHTMWSMINCFTKLFSSIREIIILERFSFFLHNTLLIFCADYILFCVDTFQRMKKNIHWLIFILTFFKKANSWHMNFMHKLIFFLSFFFCTETSKQANIM